MGKRTIASILLFSFLLGAAGCSRESAEAKRADSLIMAIGEVSLDSADYIRSAEEAVSQLTDTQRAELKHLDTLSAAEAEYAALLSEQYGEQVRQAEALIDAIGTVTRESSDAISAARRAYYELGSELQQDVANYNTLIAAENAYAALLQADFDAAAGEIEELIDAIGEVTLDSGDAIAAARAAYDAGSADVQAAVENYELLEKSEQLLSDLRIIQVETMIAALDGQTDPESESGKQIAAAAEVYLALSPEQQLAVSNRETFLKLYDAYNQALRARRQAAVEDALTRTREEPDEAKQVTWIYSTAEPLYSDERSFLLPYLCKTESGYRMYFRAWYTGESFINWTRLTITADGAELLREYSAESMTRQQGQNKVWEFHSEEITQEDIALLKLLLTAQQVEITFEGADGTASFLLSEDDRGAIADLLVIFENQES